MKKALTSVLFAICFIFVFAISACGNGSGGETPPPASPPESAGGNGNVLIVYFSWSGSGNTEKMANRIAARTNGTAVKIEAAVPYTGSYNEVAYGRAKEEHDSNVRPEVAQSTYDSIDMSKYDTVFVGYPIWWWTTPMIIATFLEYYEWTSDVDIYPFSQSASMDVSQFNTSMEPVRTSANGATVHDGLFARASDTAAIDAYLLTNSLAVRQAHNAGLSV